MTARTRRRTATGWLMAMTLTAGCITVTGSYERPPDVVDAGSSSNAADLPDERTPDSTSEGAVDLPSDEPETGSEPEGSIDGSGGELADVRPPAPTCHPRSIRALTPAPPDKPGFSEGDGAPPTCEIDDSGVLVMTYTPQDGCPIHKDTAGHDVTPYRACYFAQNEDLSAFFQNRGVLEAHYCYTGPLFDALDIWMERESSDPKGNGTALRAVQLQRPEDMMTNSRTTTTCRTVAFSLQESCGALTSCSLQPCVDSGARDAGTGGGGAGGADAGGPDGGATAVASSSCALLQRVRIRLTTEYCPPGCDVTSCVRPKPVQVRLLSFVYYPEECRCLTDDDCATGTHCRKDSLPPMASCWSAGGCRGICE